MSLSDKDSAWTSQQSDEDQAVIRADWMGKRRDFALGIAGVFSGLGLAATSGCKRKKEDRPQGLASRSDRHSDRDEEDDPRRPDFPEEEVPCKQVKKVPWKDGGFDDVGEHLEPTFKFYGSRESSLIVIGLKKFEYQSGNLTEITILRYSGEPLVTKGVTPVDIDSQTHLRPVVFDNIALRKESKLVVLFKDGSGVRSKFVLRKIVFETKFKGRKVLSLSPTSAPEAFRKKHVYPRFLPDPEDQSFLERGSLMVVSRNDARFIPTKILKGCVITDMLGTVIANKGEKFRDIMNHYQFIAYRRVGNRYVRTFVRVV